jgi:hypothetical protein
MVDPNPTQDSKPRPGRRWYLVAAAVLGLGIAGALPLFLGGVAGIARTSHRVDVPGAKELALSEPGAYTIFREHVQRESAVGSVTVDRSADALLDYALRSKSTDASVTLVPGPSTEYDLGNVKGVARYAFAIDEPGTYVLTVAYPEGTTGPTGTVAVAHEVGQRIAKTVAAIGLVFVSVVVAFVVVVVTFLTRHR